MLSDLQLQIIGWACTLLGGFLCGLLTFWLLRPKPKRMPEPPKPIPYASAVGSKPPAPWVTREEWLETEVCNSGLRDWQKHVFHELERRVTALENQRPKPVPEPLAPGVRVWRNNDNGFLYVVPPNGTDWARGHTDWYKTRSAWTAADFESDRFYTELHGPERDEVVRDWMNRTCT